MLARYAARPVCILRRAYYQPQLGLGTLNQPRRSFVSLDVLKDGFLDLAIALPIPPSWPAYTTTIILCTVLTRLVFTVPFSSKRRQWRAEEQALPRLQSEGPVIAKRVLEDMQRAKVRGTKEELQTIHHTRMKEAVAARQKELFAEYHCQPMTTMAVPPLTQVPVFVGCSIVLAHISQHPTPFDSESFLTLSTLVHPDPTATLPIALGFITLANVESSRWFMTDQQREREIKVQKWREERIAKGERVVEPQKIIKSTLRLVSVGRILIAAMVPGSVVLYWVTSATFGLVQTWMFDYWELRRKRRLAALASSPPPPPSPSSPSPAAGKLRQK
ncbi:60Kd inner membrane protein-domain-containing protein [Boletus coccyginus]|nr:60Kd inner membrane protein-domain-containing protein [Boletus coccyginus]